MYRDPQGKSYYSNASAVRLPSSFAAGVLGVVGLTNTVRMHSMIQRAPSHATAATKRSTSHSHSTPSCETPYVTAAELFTYVNSAGKDGFPYGYGGGPGCSGLTPSQTNSIYDAPNVGPRGEGAGVNLGVFELSAYQHSDIDTWAHNFYGPGYNPRLVDITVDGGPLDPVCPMGDTCPPDYNGYAGDIEVDADIETQLALSPDNSHILVYNAPNDYTGQTELDEYTAIANQDRADVVSSSWSVCENDVTAGYVEAENEVFEQMALQGQSMFGAEGDTGAFECLRSDGTTIVNVLDPPAQPWVTSVGGTSLPVNPGTNPHPSYPNGAETVWNVDNLCNNGAPSAANDDLGGLFWCDETGAGGGGSSQYWGRPFYQVGPGINNPYTTHGNGTTQCALARTGTPCREVPDISANADEYTPYAEYCTANAGTPFSACGFSASSRWPGGSASAARASPRRCGRPSSPTGTASRVAAAATSTRCSTCSTTSPPTSTSTTSRGSARPPTTTVCSRPPLDTTWRRASGRRSWRPSSPGVSDPGDIAGWGCDPSGGGCSAAFATTSPYVRRLTGGHDGPAPAAALRRSGHSAELGVGASTAASGHAGSFRGGG
jgi:kumamolisin